MPTDWKRVGELAQARRKELRLSQDAVQKLGGPSPALIRQVESGTYDASMHPGVQDGYERALEWRPGSIDLIHEGGEPLIIGQSASSSDVAAKRLEHVQQRGRRRDRISAVTIEWLQVVTRKSELEIEYAALTDVTAAEARESLHEIARAIPDAWHFESQADFELAARTDISGQPVEPQGRQLRRKLDEHDDDSQDPGGMDPA